jgi:hypothetical protein
LGSIIVKFRVLSWLFLLGILTACTSIRLEPPPLSPTPIQVVITPIIYPSIQDSLRYCASQNPGIAVSLEVLSQSTLPADQTANITILMGEDFIANGILAYQLGWEDIFLVSNPGLSIDLAKIRQDFMDSKPSLHIWTYPEGHVLRTIVEEVILENGHFSPNAMIASNPGEMVDIILKDPEAIGYIPGSWLKEGIKTIPLDPPIQARMRQPIIALTNQEPDILLSAYLACLQSSWD